MMKSPIRVTTPGEELISRSAWPIATPVNWMPSAPLIMSSR